MAAAALLLSVVAVAVAIWSVTRSPDTPNETATTPTSVTAGKEPVPAEQPAQAKTRICGAFETVRNALTLQSNKDLGNDPAAVSAVAANARLAALGGGQYLLSKLDGTVSGELSDAVRSFANELQDVGMQQLSGTSGDDPAQVKRMNDAQATATRITELCK